MTKEQAIELLEKNGQGHVMRGFDNLSEDKKKAFEAGMDAHIAKPVEIKELYKELIRLS